MESIVIKKPDIDLLKKQTDMLHKVVDPTDGYVPEGCEELEGLICFIEHVCDVAEGHEVVSDLK